MAVAFDQNTISIALNEGQLARLREALTRPEYNKAVWSAVKATTKSGKTIVSNKLRETILAKKKYVDKSLTAEMLSGPLPTGRIRISKKPMPLIAFDYHKTKNKGIWVRMLAGMPRLVLKHAFIATVKKAGADGMHEGHKGIFLRAKIGIASAKELRAYGTASAGIESRVGKLGIRKSLIKNTTRLVRVNSQGYAERLPIDEQFGPSVYFIAKQEKVLREIQTDLRRELGSNLEKQVKSQLSRFAS